MNQIIRGHPCIGRNNTANGYIEQRDSEELEPPQSPRNGSARLKLQRRRSHICVLAGQRLHVLCGSQYPSIAANDELGNFKLYLNWQY